MKKTLITLLALSGVTMGAAITDNGDGTLSSTGDQYVYSWDGSNWLYLPGGRTTGDLEGPSASYWPANARDGAIVGYSYNSNTGLFTATDDITTQITGIWVDGIGAEHAYFSGNFKFSGWGDLKTSLTTIHLSKNAVITVEADTGMKHDLTLDYGDMTYSSARFQHTSASIWANGNTITLSGSYTYSGGIEPKVIFSANNVSGELNIQNEFQVTDSSGVTLVNKGVISDINQLEKGQSAILWDGKQASLVAWSNVPEPATGTLSLLALAGLCARRRKK